MMNTLSIIFYTTALVLFEKSNAFAPLSGISVKSIRDGAEVSLDNFLSSEEKTLLIFGTYAADFNAIEYAQRLRYYMPRLKEESSVTKFGLILNSEMEAAKKMTEMVDLDLSQVEVFIDPNGNAGRVFGVGRGWLPENEDVNPFLKLFGMLWGLGAWATLPAVIGGYIGNPFTAQPWIEDALVVGTKQKRWPDNAVELDENGELEINKFTELPLVGNWPRRPLELATLRLQNMLFISIKHWKDLVPTEDALKKGVLTQLGGCIVVDSKGNSLFEWKDPGICAVANFEDILEKLK